MAGPLMDTDRRGRDRVAAAGRQLVCDDGIAFAMASLFGATWRSATLTLELYLHRQRKAVREGFQSAPSPSGFPEMWTTDPWPRLHHATITNLPWQRIPSRLD
ncbi:hypothetical protein SNOG_11821 [Parastagonospora nodorum SN15]|uniref:Uncharacterized protein n=1 Tax=Phaeosphaeria nodorum (strain SN15 / ATCC MYA-4574 / FGSC 10173) TaxID=321614 RepID=Q0U8U3_PHANO|nr:hypothetical protein SNOG_11821 [Parastagonospora nodorum SN15]EAT80865.1 hypothetical protein SNOG_11821 [Parastagonospora nodorum SN15]